MCWQLGTICQELLTAIIGKPEFVTNSQSDLINDGPLATQITVDQLIMTSQ
jgi:hypothetical protein